jgi:hypothetical protein
MRVAWLTRAFITCGSQAAAWSGARAHVVPHTLGALGSKPLCVLHNVLRPQRRARLQAVGGTIGQDESSSEVIVVQHEAAAAAAIPAKPSISYIGILRFAIPTLGIWLSGEKRISSHTLILRFRAHIFWCEHVLRLYRLARHPARLSHLISAAAPRRPADESGRHRRCGSAQQRRPRRPRPGHKPLR